VRSAAVFTLDAGASVDPDDPSDTAEPMRYEWAVRREVGGWGTKPSPYLVARCLARADPPPLPPCLPCSHPHPPPFCLRSQDFPQPPFPNNATYNGLVNGSKWTLDAANMEFGKWCAAPPPPPPYSPALAAAARTPCTPVLWSHRGHQHLPSLPPLSLSNTKGTRSP
jgi:hypothetical protein